MGYELYFYYLLHGIRALCIKADGRIFLLQATHGNINIITAQSVVENLRDNSMSNDIVNRSKFNLISERANGL